MPELNLEGLVHVYREGGLREGGVRAVDGVDLRIGSGERLAIIGQNGSGKTTLVRHLNGLLRPTAGRVLVDGADAAQMTVAQLAHSVGLVFQDPDRQIFAGSVLAEVEYGPRNLGLRGGELRSAVETALAAVGLEPEARTNPYDLGVSRRKLLALASVLAMGTAVLILDEPTTGQDERGVERVRAVIGDAHGDGRTVIAISHDMRFVAEGFERIVVMRAGRIVLDGSPEQVFQRNSWSTLESTFLEPPLPAVIGERLGLGSTPTDASLIRALGSGSVAQEA